MILDFLVLRVCDAITFVNLLITFLQPLLIPFLFAFLHFSQFISIDNMHLRFRIIHHRTLLVCCITGAYQLLLVMLICFFLSKHIRFHFIVRLNHPNF